jgi:hypothetical protein
MPSYIQECLDKTLKIKNDSYVNAYKNKLIIKLKVSKSILLLYYFFFTIPFFLNIPDFVSSRKISGLFIIGELGILSIVFAIIMLIYGIKIKNGSGFYELPIIAQTTGRKELHLYNSEYLIGLAGKDGVSMLNDIVSTLSRLKLIENGKLKLSDFRALEDIIISRRSRSII